MKHEIKIERFKVKVNDKELIGEIQFRVDTYNKLKQTPYVKVIASSLKIKEHEIYIIINDLNLQTHVGRRTGKVIFKNKIL